MKDLLLGAMAASILVGAFLVGRLQPSPAAPAAVVAAPAQLGDRYDPGSRAVVSLYNPDGRLLKFFDVRGPVEKTPAGELVFDTADGKRVRTNASYILEGTPPTAPTTR